MLSVQLVRHPSIFFLLFPMFLSTTKGLWIQHLRTDGKACSTSVTGTDANYFRVNSFFFVNRTFCPEYPKVQLLGAACRKCFVLMSFLSAVFPTQSWKALLFHRPSKHCSESSSISNNHICAYIRYKHSAVRNSAAELASRKRFMLQAAKCWIILLFQVFSVVVNTLVTLI